MGKIFITSDAHFSHIQPFVWEARGYKSVEEMNKEQIRKWNEVVGKDDEVWFLGDGMMNDNATGTMCWSKLNGKIHIITGNHDSPARIEIYKQLGFDVEIKKLGYKKCIIPESNKKLLTSNGRFKGWRDTINIHGHTHQTTNFTEGYHLMYHAGVDSHDGYPVSLDDIIRQIEAHWEKLGMQV